jgi:hypothetical protein
MNSNKFNKSQEQTMIEEVTEDGRLVMKMNASWAANVVALG